MDNTYILLGCGGHARSIADVIYYNNYSSDIIFVDENAREGERIMGFPVVKNIQKNRYKLIPASGNNDIRKKQFYDNENIVTIIAKTASISFFSSVGKGCFIGHGAHIGPESIIGDGTLINTNAVIEHEVTIGTFCHIAPNSTVCGRCSLGDNVFLGVGAIIKENISVCHDVKIGAGAVVIKDIMVSGTYIGCPARQVGN